MFNRSGVGGFGQPGGRSISVMSVVTEVKIALLQALLGSAAWLVLAFILHRVVAINAGDAIIAAHPETFAAVVAVQTFIWRADLVVITLVHLGGLGVAMAANVLNPNWPPPFAAQNPVDVVFPRYLRALLGMGWLRRDPEKESPVQNQNSPIPAVAVQPMAVTLEWNANGNARKKRRATIALYSDEWQGLATLAADDRHFSTRELATVLGDKRAREVLTALRAARLVESRGNSTTAIDPLMAWLKSGGSKHLHPGDNGIITI
jgi:hypothetical protein